MISVAFDIGGTFTDFVLSDDRIWLDACPQGSYQLGNPGEAVIEGLEKLLAEHRRARQRRSMSFCMPRRWPPMPSSSAKGQKPVLSPRRDSAMC